MVYGVSETRDREDNFESIRSKTFGSWEVSHNYTYCPNKRIWVAWDSNIVRFEIIYSSAQAIHGKVILLTSDVYLACYFVYGSNVLMEKNELWINLVNLAHVWRINHGLFLETLMQ